MKKVLLLVLASLVLTNTYLFATTDYEMKPYTGSAEFERLKSLAGTWKGTTTEPDGKKWEGTVEYAVTSNGSAVTEKLFAGTPHEMVSVYHDTKGKLSMTHYCGLGNRPELSLVSSTDNEMQFVFSNPSEIDPAKEMHMHSLKLTFDGKDKLVQDWKLFKDGSDAGDTVISLSRQS